MFENLKRSQSGGTARGWFGPVSPKRRILLMVALLIVLGSGYGWLQGVSKRGRTAAAEEDFSESFQKFGDVRDVDLGDVNLLSDKLAEQIHDATPEEQRTIDEKILSYLLTEVETTPAVYHYGRGLIPIVPGSAAQIEKAPEPWRFKFCTFRGELEYLRDERYEKELEGTDVEFIYRGRVRIAGGETPLEAVFITTIRPTWYDEHTPMLRPIVQDLDRGWVRVTGIFVQRYLDKNEGGTETPALLFVATQVHRDYETQPPVKTLDKMGFEVISDGPGVIGTEAEPLLYRLYPLPLFRLVRYARSHVGPEGAAVRKAEGFTPRGFEDKNAYKDLLYRPEEHRGEVLGGLGALASIPFEETVGSKMANDSGIEQFLTGWVLMDSRKVFKFVAPIELARPDFKKLQRVRYEGYFYKAQAYPRRGGRQEIHVPVLVLTRLDEVMPPVRDMKSELIFALAFTGGIAAILFFILREDKTKRDYRELRKRARAAAMQAK